MHDSVICCWNLICLCLQFFPKPSLGVRVPSIQETKVGKSQWSRIRFVSFFFSFRSHASTNERRRRRDWLRCERRRKLRLIKQTTKKQFFLRANAMVQFLVQRLPSVIETRASSCAINSHWHIHNIPQLSFKFQHPSFHPLSLDGTGLCRRRLVPAQTLLDRLFVCQHQRQLFNSGKNRRQKKKHKKTPAQTETIELSATITANSS